MSEQDDRVCMVRDENEFPESFEANVRPDDVAAFEKLGWKAAAGGQSEAVALSAPLAGTGEGEALPLAIPDDWRELHWKQRVALAKELGWVDGEPSAEQANGWISDIIEHRRREEPQEALGGLSIREAHDKLTKAGVEWEAGATVEDLAAMLATVA
jgi:hypothetical protein